MVCLAGPRERSSVGVQSTLEPSGRQSQMIGPNFRIHCLHQHPIDYLLLAQGLGINILLDYLLLDAGET